MTVTVIEIDIPYCDLTYGVAPCTAVLSPGNLAPNSSFEDDANANDRPDDWEDTSVGSGITVVRSLEPSPLVAGAVSFKTDVTVISPPTALSIHGFVSSVASAIPVTVGRLYTASVYVQTSTLTYQARVRIDWRDSGGSTISSSFGVTHTFSVVSAFARISVSDTAPSGAVTARLRLELVRPSTSDTTLGSLVWDAFQFQEGALTDWHLPGFTGTKKCFNTIRTCQDRANFTPSPLTLRFCMPAGDVEFTRLGQPVVVIPSIKSVGVTPAIINPGVDVGTRETVRVVFEEHPHSDAGLDKYLDDRDYDPFQRGTFFAKLRARNPSLEGYALRMLIGEEGDALEDMTTYNYVIDSMSGLGEQVTIVAKDVLILADKKKAQAPRISNGVLAANITDVQTSAVLEPAGIGNAEYPASGKVAIGGKEVCTFTRSGDTLTLTRGQSGTDPDEHDEGDIVQLVLIYESEEPSTIINDLLVTYTPGIDASWINTSEWATEVDEYIGRLYSAEIADPTSVVDLLNELIEQVGLVFWWDAIALQLRLRSLRPVSAEAKIYNEDHTLATTFRATEQPGKRISEAWTYYGLRNPLEPIDEARNYRAAIATIDANADLDYEQPAIKKVFSRWIASNNRAAASRLNSMLLSRFRDAPRKFTFALYATIDEAPTLGGGFQVQAWSLQDDTGVVAPVPAQVTSIEPREDRYIVDAQESIFAPQDDLETAKVIFIDENTQDANLRSLHDQIYSEPQEYDIIRCIIREGVIAGAFVIGDWPEFVDITIINNGRIQGAGGRGASLDPGPGSTTGGTALYTRQPITIENNGQIWGGGGGGGIGRLINVGTQENPSYVSAGGGGGAGYAPGSGGQYNGSVGTTESGGAGGELSIVVTSRGGNGGGPASAGLAGNDASSSPGAAGLAVDGESYITWTTEGAILGARVN